MHRLRVRPGDGTYLLDDGERVPMSWGENTRPKKPPVYAPLTCNVRLGPNPLRRRRGQEVVDSDNIIYY